LPPQRDDFTSGLAWLRDFTPATRSAAAALPSLQSERLLVVCHLDLKMVPYFEALLAAGADVYAGAAPSISKFSRIASPSRPTVQTLAFG